MKTIEVTIGTEGEVQIEALGYKGSDCLAATRALEQAIGAVQERRLKPEFAMEAELVTGTNS